jgi:hypothetical protein
MKCKNTDRRKETFVFHINRNHKKVGDECHKKNRKEVTVCRQYYIMILLSGEDILGGYLTVVQRT